MQHGADIACSVFLETARSQINGIGPYSLGYVKSRRAIYRPIASLNAIFSKEWRTMTCYHPLKAFQLLGQKTENGKALFVFNESKINGHPYVTVPLKCGQCVGCLVARSKEQALRCVHEASCYKNNCYVTLTFNEETLQGRKTLVKADFQGFIKRLRKGNLGKEPVCSDNGTKTIFPIRYYMCGEYGEVCEVCGKSRNYHCRTHRFVPSIGRPHYHACLFNFDFEDKYYWSTVRGNRYYRSETLERAWSLPIERRNRYDYKSKDVYKRAGKYYAKCGYATISDVNFRSAAYIARYCTKKITGERADAHYRVVDTATGEIVQVLPEYVAMSNRPGLGKTWFNAYGFRDCYPKDYVTHRGRKYSVPRYYDRLLERVDPGLAGEIKRKRCLTALENAPDNTPERLAVRKKIFTQKIGKLERRYEINGTDVCDL